MGQGGTEEPRSVGGEVARRDVLEPCPLLEVADGELDSGMGSVEGVDGDGVTLQIGHEGEVTPLGPQGRLGSDEPGPTHDEATTLVGALGHLGQAVGGVVDRGPGSLVDHRGGPVHGLHHANAHRVAHSQALEGGDGGIGPEPRVEAHDQLAGRPGPAQPGYQLFDEALGAALGVRRPLAHPDMKELTGGRQGGEQGVVAEPLGVAVAGTVFGFAAHLGDGRVEVDDDCRAPGPAPRLQARRSASAKTASSCRT